MTEKCSQLSIVDIQSRDMMLRGGSLLAAGLLRVPYSYTQLCRPVSLCASPQSGMADDRLHITVQGLSPRQQVTLRALVTDEQGRLFDSCAHYEADSSGTVDLQRDASLGGDYTGVLPMGLLWSLSPSIMEKPFQRLEKRSIMKSPMITELLVHKGHTHPKAIPGQVAARTKIERLFYAPGVRRIRLREGAVRGSLFLPPGEGSFPGVIDMFGDEGGLVEYRSSLLASHGFAALALPYLAFEDLPPAMIEFHLEYFEEAAKFLSQHPKVRGPGVGVIGTGKGADLALSMITFLPQVVAAVSISGCCANTAASLSYKDLTIPGLTYNMSRVQVSETAVFDVSEALDDPLDPDNSQCLIPVEKANGTFMFVVGENDLYWKSSVYAQAAIDRLQQHSKNNFTLLTYPGAGHRIDPPCSPFCVAAVDRVLGVPILGGGELKAHCQAQEDSWQKIQDFFHFHLR
ncbi:LOW QUALITY PROTEIN: acyl-coenzyme A thioesterase 1-like [Aquarana catesbeiana]|uniref:LOW QUALITY PROTEIN: acyl-coenzyme A thioesterase 1-like n=1 Tax=Aquarana catesbeiana TaxID=8400 RepID=UPI003CC947FB